MVLVRCYSRPLFALLVLLAWSPGLFAGKEFHAGPKESVVSGQLLVGLQPGASITQILNGIEPQATATIVSAEQNVYLVNLPPGVQTTVSQLLAAHPLVNYVEPNRVRNTSVTPPNDTYMNQQWNLTAINAVQAWSFFPDQYLTAATASGSRTMVAILDTGVDCTHPDFMNAGGTSTAVAQGGQLSWTASMAIQTTTVANPACTWQDDNGHGTHTAGILAAATNNATGIASLGFPLQLMVVKTSAANGNATDFQVSTGMYDAINAGAQVISMSLGGAGYSQTLQSAIDYAWAHNVLVVAAAGNTGDTTLIYPGAGNHALAVGATDGSNTVAYFSTYGNWVKIAAPGVSITSTWPTYSGPEYCCNYGQMEGTSMATPHVAALAGLIYAANPGISVAEVAQRIEQTAQSPNTGWNEYIGYGVINAGAALGNIPAGFTQGALTGQVTDIYGNPITGAVVSTGSGSYTTAPDTNTGDENGLFRINLAPGTYPITVTATNYRTVNTQAVVVAGADTMMTIQMNTTAQSSTLGDFTGTVTYNGVGVAGAVVTASASGAIQGTATTNASGGYTLFINAGTYTLTASAPNYISTTSGSQSLSANGSVTVNLALSAMGNIIGNVTDINGLPVSNAHIDFTGASFTGGATTGANGSYATYGLPAGTYTVTASATGYAGVSVTSVSVTANTSTVINLQFATGISLTNGLIGYWPFNEGSGATAYDQSGHGYNAALNNVAWTTGLLFSSAVSFSGSNSYATTPSISFTGPFSVSLWVNSAASESSWVSFVGMQSSPGWSLGINQNGNKYKFIVDGGTGTTGDCAISYIEEGCTEGGTIATGWHMLTGTYDGVTAILYIDGVAIASDTMGGPNSSSALEFGQNWSGAMQSLRVYNRTLSASEVSTLFNQAAVLGLTDTPDAASVAEGSAIGYTLTVSNSGAGSASSTVLTDVLPAGTGISWSISPAYSGPGACAIVNGTLTCNIGSLSAGANTSVHVTSATTSSNCAVFSNAASVSSSNGGSAQASANISVTCSQTITFGALANQTFGAAPFTISATASSNFPVSFNSQTGSVCTVSGNTVTIVSAGTCTIQATLAGNGNYTAATPVDQSFLVAQASQTITFNGPPNQPLSAATVTISATATSGSPVSFNSLTSPICTVSGATVTLLATGTCIIQATQSGNTNYAAAPAVSQSFQISLATQTINFTAIANQPLGTAPFTVNATASSNLPVTFTSQTTPVCSISATTVTLVAIGTCIIQASQTGSSSYAATSVNQSFLVTGAIGTAGVSTLSFPNTVVGRSSAVETFSFQNTGNTPLTISSIAIAGADAANYQYTADAVHPCPISPATLAASVSCVLDVTFVPQSQGSHSSAQITITDNSGNVPGTTQSIGLAGTGIVLSSITITANSASLVYGSSEQFTATGKYSDNSTADVTGQAAWLSSAAGVATVTAGLAVSVAAGQTNIACTLSGITSNSFQLTVVAGTPANISGSSGSGQSAAVGSTFGSLLQALVTDGARNAVPNASVTFTAPASGASGTFANGSTVYTTTTNSSGIATSSAFTANASGGSYLVAAGVSGVATQASFSLTNVKSPSLTITETMGMFTPGQSSSFTITVSNASNAGPTSGILTLTVSVPSGFSVTALNGGSAWSCNVQTLVCSNSNGLAPGASSQISVTVSVSSTAQGSSSIGVSVTGGGSQGASKSSPASIGNACSVTQGAGNATISDVQEIVNEALGLAPLKDDLNGDGVINAVDLQIVINSVLNLGCSGS